MNFLKRAALATIVAGLVAGCGNDGALVDTSPPPSQSVLDAYTVIASRYDSQISVFHCDPSNGSEASLKSYFFAGTACNDLAFHPNQQWFYVSGGFTKKLLSLKLALEDGGLSSLSPETTLSFSTFGVTLDGQGKFLYTFGTEGIDGYSIDQATGVLTQLTGFPKVFAGAQFQLGVVDRGNQFLYVSDITNSQIRGFQILGAGQLQEVTGSPFAVIQAEPPLVATQPFALAIDSSNQFLYANTNAGQVQGFRIGAGGTLVGFSVGQGGTKAGADAGGLTVRGNELLAGDANNDITSGFTIQSDGTLVPISGAIASPFGGGGCKTEFLPGLPLVISADFSNARMFIQSVDPSGALTQVVGSPLTVPRGPFGHHTVTFRRSI